MWIYIYRKYYVHVGISLIPRPLLALAVKKFHELLLYSQTLQKYITG